MYCYELIAVIASFVIVLEKTLIDLAKLFKEFCRIWFKTLSENYRIKKIKHIDSSKVLFRLPASFNAVFRRGQCHGK